MITIIHGDNVLQIQKTLDALKKKSQEKELIVLQKPDALTLRQHLSTPAMFFDNRLTIVEKFLTKGMSQEVIDFLSMLPQDTSCVFVEYTRLDRSEKAAKNIIGGKKLLDALKKQVKGLQIIACNDYALFDFLETLKPGQVKEVITRFDDLISKDYEAEAIFAIVVDHVRNLIIAKDLGPKGLSDMHEFRRNKMLVQSRAFTLQQLRSIYQKLFQLEIAQKEKRQGEGSPFSMEEDLRFLLSQVFSK